MIVCSRIGHAIDTWAPVLNSHLKNNTETNGYDDTKKIYYTCTSRSMNCCIMMMQHQLKALEMQ